MNFLESVGVLTIMFLVIYAYKEFLEHQRLNKTYKLPDERLRSDEDDQFNEENQVLKK